MNRSAVVVAIHAPPPSGANTRRAPLAVAGLCAAMLVAMFTTASPWANAGDAAADTVVDVPARPEVEARADANDAAAPSEIVRMGWNYLPADATVAGACRPAAFEPFPRLTEALRQRFLPGLDLTRLIDLAQEHLLFAWNPARADSLCLVMRLARPLTVAECAQRLGRPAADAVALSDGHTWPGADGRPGVALLERGSLLMLAYPSEFRRLAARGQPAEARALRISPELMAEAGSLTRPEALWVAAVPSGDAWIRAGNGHIVIVPPTPAGESKPTNDAGETAAAVDAVDAVEAAGTRLRAHVVFEAVSADQARAIDELAGLLPLLTGVPPERLSMERDGARRTVAAWMTETEALRLLGAAAPDDGAPATTRPNW